MPSMEKGKLSDTEKKIMETLSKGTFDELKILLNEPGVRINCLDDTGMTFLQHAAFRGKADLCEFLLAKGADVHSNYHDNNYSTLTFAALSGNVPTTKIVLEAGANINHENNLGRTATQMAAFVGQHACVTLINNFVPVTELEYYTIPHGLEKEGKLKKTLLTPLYLLLNVSNLHPVHISNYLNKHREILEDSYNITKVLHMICEKSMKSQETNDVKALKSFYMASIITASSKAMSENSSLDKWIKMLVKGRESDGYPENQELFIRGCLKEFPYMESQLLQQLIRNIAPVKIGDSPTAFSMLVSGINGHQFFKDEDSACSTCAETQSTKKCTACKMVNYCNADCQKLHWSTHKNFCAKLAEKYKLIEERKAREEELAKQEKENEKKNQTEVDDKDLSDEDIPKVEEIDIHDEKNGGDTEEKEPHDNISPEKCDNAI